MGRFTRRLTAGRLAALGGAVAVALVAGSTPALAAEAAAPRRQPDCAAVDARVDGRLLAALGVAGLLDARVLRPQVVPCPPLPRPAPIPTPPRSAGYATSAAAIRNWGEPTRVEEFTGTRLGNAWNVYDGPGHAGRGRRTPRAVGLRNGILTMTGDSRGNTAGMEWGGGQRYGRWEGRVRAPAGDPSYSALMLLWPDAENFPVGGEIDFMEMMDPTRQKTNVFLHYGRTNRQVSGSVRVDATQWHNWAVEWTPTHVVTFLDGKEWWRTERAGILPPGPMHLCIQLDWFPRSARGPVRPSTMQVDWVKQYTLSPDELRDGRGRGRR
jgi:hypothetical protein